MTDSKAAAASGAGAHATSAAHGPAPGVLLKALRAVMREHKIDAYLVPTADAHQSEYVADCDKRRAALTGFTGSAGTALVTVDPDAADKGHGLLWTDGRYFLQASQQLADAHWKLMKQGVEGVPTTEDWLLQNLKAGARVGYDSTTVPLATARKMELAFGAKLALVPMAHNLVDAVWSTRPAAPAAPCAVQPHKYTGSSTAEKVARIRKAFDPDNKDDAVHALVVTALDEVAWLFNLRGADIAFNPVFFSYGLVTRDATVLYVDPAKVAAADVKAHLAASDVTVKPYSAFLTDLKALPVPAKGKVWVDPVRVSKAVYDAVLTAAGAAKAAAVYEKQSPVQMLKSVKNSTELDGMRAAHVRDAAAVVNFLSWLEEKIAAHPNADGKDNTLTECNVSDKLESFRAAQPDFVGLSFETIAGAGPNGAIIHYKPEPETCRALKRSEVFLLDSGAQFRDGTTDITRTVHFGTPTAFEKRCNTRVLQGHIALAQAVFPPGTPGTAVDCLARTALWRDGLNYQHGTGHGVGAFLNVHEGPQGIAALVREGSAAGVTPLTAGMILSNEPGYYHPNGAPAGLAGAAHPAFGIRIENLVAVVEAKTPNKFNGQTYLTFETITLVPIDRALIDLHLLSQGEVDWLNAYHADCRKKVSPLLQGAALQWLVRNTEPLALPKAH